MRLSQKIYSVLYKHFGPQGWWPVTPSGQFSPVYHSGRTAEDLSESERFEICVGALLTQNTAWTNVEKALAALHRAVAFSPQKIARMPFQTLARLIRPSGYFRQKAKRLKFFSRYLIDRYEGKIGTILKKPLDVARKELLSLHGVGPETADSILLYAGGYPIFVVDAYTKRIGRRTGLFRSDEYLEIQSYFHRYLERSAPLYNEVHALLVALGKNICKSKPLCGQCPIQKICITGKKVLNQ